MSRRYNPNLSKIHYSYTMGEASDLFGVHKNTIRAWMRDGLPFSDDSRPFLICGYELREYLKQKYRKAKRPCKENEMYCFKCRQPQKPAGDMVDYVPVNESKGRLVGLCACCGGVMNRFALSANLEQIQSIYEVTIRQVTNT
jgi:hypothetical protein